MSIALPGSAYDEDHESFRESARKFLESHVVPHLDQWRAAGAIDDGVIREAGAQGFLGTLVPEEYGGGGVGDPRFTAVLLEEAMAAGAAGFALLLALHGGVCVPAVLRLPDSDDRAAWLTGLATGELQAVPVVLGPGLAAAGVPGAATAGLFVVAVPSDDGDLGVVVLPRSAVGVEPAPGGAPLGGREAAAADVRVDPELLVHAHRDPDRLLRRDLDLWSAVLAVAGAQAGLDLTRSYVAERTVFGRPVASFENTSFRLGELAAQIAAARALTESCLTGLADGSLLPATAAAARVTGASAHDRAVDQGMQLHGGYGYMREYPISHAFADARFLRLAAAATSDPRAVLAGELGL
jgi:acyl-CoA dehydrogenase